MKPLEIHCRNRVMYAKISVRDRGSGRRDYVLTGKDGVSLYVFNKEKGHWKCTLGYLDEDIKEAIVNALIIRFDKTICDIFYYKGERKLVEVREKQGNLWHIYVNLSYVATISYDKFTRRFEYNLEDESGVVTDDHIRKYIGKIGTGEISWYKGDR